jgi:hypothetical protein
MSEERVQSAPTNAAGIAKQLGVLAVELGKTVAQMQAADLAATKARSRYDFAFSSAFLAAEGPVDVRKHEALVATHDLREEAEVAEALLRHLNRRINEIRVRIDVGRSYGAAVRAEVAAMPGIAA